MEHTVKRICIDTAALPAQKAVFEKIYPIVKKRIEGRCGAVCQPGTEPGVFVLRFVLDESVPDEGFHLTDLEDGIQISGAGFLALMYGAGQFLHKSRYTAQGIVPTQWRGESVPQTSKRMIFFAQHFYNWYQCCSAQEIREHI